MVGTGPSSRECVCMRIAMRMSYSSVDRFIALWDGMEHSLNVHFEFSEFIGILPFYCVHLYRSGCFDSRPRSAANLQGMVHIPV